LNRRRFDLVEILVIAVFVGFCVLNFERSRLPPYGFTEPATWAEIDRLKATYGPAHYSQFHEEWIIRDFFRDKREGVFADVGANHYRDGSTTFYLEKQLGWSGVAIDPQREFESDYRTYRPRTRFFPFFVSDVSNQTAKLYMVNFETQTVSANRPMEPLALTTEMSAPTVTLTDLLDQLAIRRVDFVSVDVEGSEPKVLEGFDIEKFRPTLVCIEAHVEVRQQILDFFARHAYVVVGKYLRVDTLNLYFTPLAPAK
jgi:FkbM family methyltransferase